LGRSDTSRPGPGSRQGPGPGPFAGPLLGCAGAECGMLADSGWTQFNAESGGPMRRSPARALTGALALITAAALAPLASPHPALADSVVVGGYPVRVDESPWVVALSSRDRFGVARAGQFCGGVVVAPTKVMTAAHCLSRTVLGQEVSEV